MMPVDLATLLNRPANRPAKRPSKRPASAVPAAPASKKPSACQVEIIDESDLEDLLEREIDGGANLPLVSTSFRLIVFFRLYLLTFFYQLCRLLQIFKDLMLHFFLGRPPFPMPESFADLGPVPEFTAAPRKKSS